MDVLKAKCSRDNPICELLSEWDMGTREWECQEEMRGWTESWIIERVLHTHTHTDSFIWLYTTRGSDKQHQIHVEDSKLVIVCILLYTCKHTWTNPWGQLFPKIPIWTQSSKLFYFLYFHGNASDIHQKNIIHEEWNCSRNLALNA